MGKKVTKAKGPSKGAAACEIGGPAAASFPCATELPQQYPNLSPVRYQWDAFDG